MDDDKILDIYFDFDLYEETTKNAPNVVVSAVNDTKSTHRLALAAVGQTTRAMMAAVPQKQTHEIPTCNYPVVKDPVDGSDLKPIMVHHNRLTVDPSLANENWGDEFVIPADGQPKYQHPDQDLYSLRDTQTILIGMVIRVVEKANEEQKKDKPKHFMTPQEKNQALSNFYGYFIEAGRMTSETPANLYWDTDVVTQRKLVRRMWARVITSPYPTMGYHARYGSGVCAGSLIEDLRPFA